MEPKGRCFSQIDEGVDPADWVPSTCGFCSIGCGVDVAVTKGRIVGVRGRSGHPVNDGRLGPKGLNQYFANRHSRRATHPLIRNGAGKLVRATWDDAMELVVGRFNEALALHGPDAVAVYNSGQLLLEEYYVLGKIVRAGLGTANIDANTRLCTATTAAALMENFGADGPPGAYEDFEKTECIVLVGHNAAEQSTVLWMRILAAKAGPLHPKVIVIDPRRTLTVATGADLHLQVRPGTNLALLNGLCHLLIESGSIDRDFIAQHTRHFDRLQAIVSAYPPDVVTRICGVPEDKLRLAAEWIGRSASTVTTCLQGVYQSHQATASACAVNNMHLLMGKIGRAGCAPLQFAGQPSSMNTRETGANGTYPAYRNWEDPQHMQDLAHRWKVPVELLGKKPVSTPQIFELCAQGYVKVLWTIATNPAASMTDRSATLRALQNVFLVVQDGFMDTETAQLADVLLPAAIWGEKTGCMTNAERRCTLLTKAVDPPEEARPDFDIFVDFARRMNLRDRHGQPLIGVDTPEAAFDEWREVSRGCIPDYSGMSYRRLRETGGLQWPCTEKKPDGTIRLYEEPRFPTHWRIAESYEKDIATGHERSLQEYRDRSDDAGRASFVATHYEPATEGPDAKHELIVTSGRLAHHWHTRSKSARAPMLAAAAPQAFITMNVDDARARGIEDGDRVRLTSRRGVVEAQAKVGNVAPPGVVFMPFHFGELGDEHSPNNLMPRTWDPVSQQPVQKLAFVDLQRVDVAESAPWWRPDKA